MESTNVPGIYRRGSRFVVRFREDGRNKAISRATMPEAIEVRQAAIAAKDPVEAERLKLMRRAKVREAADLGDAYSFLRRAMQALDNVGLPLHREARIGEPLRLAEDRLIEEMRG